MKFDSAQFLLDIEFSKQNKKIYANKITGNFLLLYEYKYTSCTDKKLSLRTFKFPVHSKL